MVSPHTHNTKGINTGKGHIVSMIWRWFKGCHMYFQINYFWSGPGLSSSKPTCLTAITPLRKTFQHILSNLLPHCSSCSNKCVIGYLRPWINRRSMRSFRKTNVRCIHILLHCKDGRFLTNWRYLRTRTTLGLIHTTIQSRLDIKLENIPIPRCSWLSGLGPPSWS